MQNIQKYIDFYFVVCYNKFIEASNILVLRVCKDIHIGEDAAYMAVIHF